MQKNLLIIGMGLIGGSLVKALAKSDEYKVLGYNRTAKIVQEAHSLGLIFNKDNDLEKLVAQADIIIFATPLKYYQQIAQAIKASLKKEVIISDIGSVKEKVLGLFEKEFGEQFYKNIVPAHPIAGSEKTGFVASRTDLFENKQLFITPSSRACDESISEIKNIWKIAGCNIHKIDANHHDKIYAEISHLPQYLAFVYKEFCDSLGVNIPNHKFTRICDSDEEMWSDIFDFNHTYLKSSVRRSKKYFQEILNSNQQWALLKSSRSRIAINQAASEENMKFKKDDKVFTTQFILPLFIAHAVVETVMHIEFAGSGFRDFTSLLLDIPKNIKEVLDSNQQQIKSIASDFNSKITF